MVAASDSRLHESGMLASAAVWRRLADTYRVAESGLNAPQDKVAVLEDLEARSREQEDELS
jgi:hypothetical protein